jgi:hypothetical protein
MSIYDLEQNPPRDDGRHKQHLKEFENFCNVGLQAYKENALIAVTDAHGRKEIEKVCEGCEREMRPILERATKEANSYIPFWLKTVVFFIVSLLLTVMSHGLLFYIFLLYMSRIRDITSD